MIVRAPATSANLGPVFDAAAVALDLWNELEVTDGEGVELVGEGEGELPADESNLAVRAYALLADPAGKRFRFENRIPLERGLGSSAAAIALGLAAARPDAAPEELLAAGRELESHADNLAAALVGGVTLTWDGRIARIAETLPLTAVALVPLERTSTEASRGSLPATVSHVDAAANAGRAALLAAGAAAGDAALFAAGLDDLLHEPYRPSAALDAVRDEPARRRARRDALRVWADRDRLGRRCGRLRAGAGTALPRATTSSCFRSPHEARCDRARRLPSAAPRTRRDTSPRRCISTPSATSRRTPTTPRWEAGTRCPTPRRSPPPSARRGSTSSTFVLAYDEGTGWAARCWWLLRHLGHDGCGTFDLRSYVGPRRRGGADNACVGEHKRCLRRAPRR